MKDFAQPPLRSPLPLSPLTLLHFYSITHFKHTEGKKKAERFPRNLVMGGLLPTNWGDWSRTTAHSVVLEGKQMTQKRLNGVSTRG